MLLEFCEATVCHGVVVGGAGGAFEVPTSAVISATHFEERRCRANAPVNLGLCAFEVDRGRPASFAEAL